jgi:hypothetical protein
MSKDNKQTQKVHVGTAVSSAKMSVSTTEDQIMFGFPAEKITMVCSGTLTVTVDGILGDVSVVLGAVAGTPVTTVLTDMIAGVKITRTAGDGQLMVLAK